MPHPEPASSQTVGALYSEHFRWLHAWLQRRLRDHHQAADLAQDTFVNLLSRPQALPSLHEPRAFLSTVARGLLVDYWRRRDIERAWAETLAAQPEALHPSPEAQVQALQALFEIDRKLQRLGERVRAAFLMHRLQDMTHPAIAAALGVSERTVRNDIAQAMLSFLLDEDLQPEGWTS